MARSSTSLTRGDLSASAESGSRQERKDEMAKGREESDGRETPKSRRKTVLTTLKEWMWGGRATTASEQTRQLELFSETADSPKGADGGAAQIPTPAQRPRRADCAQAATERLPPTLVELLPRAAPRRPGTGDWNMIGDGSGPPSPYPSPSTSVGQHIYLYSPSTSPLVRPSTSPLGNTWGPISSVCPTEVLPGGTGAGAASERTSGGSRKGRCSTRP